MHYTFENVICSCGSTKCRQECQEFSTEGGWTTKSDRMSNPLLIKSKSCPDLWKADPEWFVCDNCGKDADLILVKAELAKIDWSKMMLIETPGISVLNTRGVKKTSINN